MAMGRFRIFGGLIRRGKETQDGVGQALRDAHPMEIEADDAMQRCIDALKDVEGTLRGRLNDKPAD
jgi:hypothetical protein